MDLPQQNNTILTTLNQNKMKATTGNNLAFIGMNSGLSATTLTNSTLIGFNAGRELTVGDGIVIIGDNITSLDRSQENVMFIGEKVAIGKTLFGEPFNLFELLSKFNSGNITNVVGTKAL